ncbi:MAG: hypothetical protein K8T26_14525 [Lentisphaerae bacterium]|nr:hypothetical protein [Lentisphaerota bacterium]
MTRKEPARSAAARLTLSWRIGLPHWETDDAFGQVLKLLIGRRAVVDEVALFETITHHLYIPLDVYARRMELAAQRLDAFRRAGISSVGINVLCTIGHLNEAWSYMPPLPFQAMVGHDGAVSTSCACPNTAEMRAYVRAKYALVARARPDFIWVDDDIRMHEHGVQWGCYCPTCLALFAKAAGTAFSREELVKAFNEPAAGRLRRLWVEQNVSSIESLLAEVASAVQAVNPRIATGLMTAGPAWTTYSGQAFDRWFTALRATKARPGGGFYDDVQPLRMFHKAIECGRQRVALPEAVADVQYELENFPYQRLKKSTSTIINECSLALAYGLNGVAFNMLGVPTALDDVRPWVDAIPAARPLWEQWVAHAAGLPTAGLWPAWSRHLTARRAVHPGEDWLTSPAAYDIQRPRLLGEIGLPLAADAPGCGTVLSGRIAECFNDEELTAMLSGGVLMDSTALKVLTVRGLGHLTGVRIARELDNGMMERFTADKLNGGAAGSLRDARIEFWGDAKGMADVLEPLAPDVRLLAELEDYFYRPQGACATAYENTLGGRVVVMGYAPWMFLQSVGKRLQLQNVADWISRGRMPVRVDEAVPLVSVVRLSANRRRAAVMLVNAGFDVIRSATVHLRVSGRRARELEVGARPRVRPLTPEKGGSRLILRQLAPWSLRVVLVGD